MSNYSYSTYLLELFELQAEELIKWLMLQQIGIFEPIQSKKVKTLFSNIRRKFAYFSWEIESGGLINTFIEYNGKSCLASPEDLTSVQIKVFGKKGSDYEVTFRRIGDVFLEKLIKSNPNALERFIHGGIRRWLPKNLKLEGLTIYKPNIDLIAEMKLTPQSPLLKHFRAHPGANIYVRKYGGKIYLHISPITKLVSNRSIWNLLRDPTTTAAAHEYVGYARLAIGRTAEIRKITDTPADAHIARPPFDGQNFLQFAADNYPNITLTDPRAKLAVVVPLGLSNSWIFSTEAMYPSFNFQAINMLDPTFFKNLLGIIKARSIERLENAQSFVKEIMPFLVFNKVVEVSYLPYSKKVVERAPFLQYGMVNASNITEFPKTEQGAVFETPSITLRIRDDNSGFVEKTIYPGIDGLNANLNDLMKHDYLAPLEIQDEIKVTVIIDKRLEQKWIGEREGESFEDAIVKGVKGDKGAYRGFTKTFKSILNITQRFIVSDLLGEEFDEILKQISPTNCHCVILVIPRRAETLELSKRIYLIPKEKIMHKGIPVQVVTDEEERFKGDLRVKAKDPYVVFGMALNIVGKTGTRMTSFSEEFSNRIIGNAVIVGYNVTRIMPKPRRLEQTASIEELVGKTIPLIAPLFILDNRGSRVLHWNFYRPTTEVSLFSEFGNDIFKRIKGDVDRIIVHKDGMFTKSELEDLQSYSAGRKIIPISLTHSSSARMHNAASIGIGSEVRRGLFIRLDDRHFQLVNTTIASWKAESWGWPRPLGIEFHNELDHLERLKLLYQIFALTKMHFGSQRPTRSPISIHYANLVSRFLRALGDEAPSFHHSFTKIFEEKGIMPLWFL